MRHEKAPAYVRCVRKKMGERRVEREKKMCESRRVVLERKGPEWFREALDAKSFR